MIIGLFTRLVAAALAIEMLVALLFVHLPKGTDVVVVDGDGVLFGRPGRTGFTRLVPSERLLINGAKS